MRLIDADELKKEFGYTDEWYKSRTVTQIIDNAPTVEDRPKGKWLFKEITNDYKVYGQCSICTQRKRIDNFCPNCGAQMVNDSVINAIKDNNKRYDERPTIDFDGMQYDLGDET